MRKTTRPRLLDRKDSMIVWLPFKKTSWIMYKFAFAYRINCLAFCDEMNRAGNIGFKPAKFKLVREIKDV